MLAALEAGDDGMARSHPLGQLLLREAELHALADHQPRELLVGLLLFESGSVRSALASPLFHDLRVGRSDWRVVPTSHFHPISLTTFGCQCSKIAKFACNPARTAWVPKLSARATQP